MSMTRFRKDAYDMGISVASLKALAPVGGATPGPATAVALISAADATDAATTQSLTNTEKAKINELITALKARRIIL